jgi:hypothetical protein
MEENNYDKISNEGLNVKLSDTVSNDTEKKELYLNEITESILNKGDGHSRFDRIKSRIAIVEKDGSNIEKIDKNEITFLAGTTNKDLTENEFLQSSFPKELTRNSNTGIF